MSREDQFRQWAKVVYEKLAQNVLSTQHKGLAELEAFKQEQYQILAQAGYDLASFAFGVLPETAMYPGGVEQLIMCNIPDMEELPEEQEE